MFHNISRRNSDFLATARRIIKANSAAPLSSKAVVTQALHSGAPSFYVSFDTALRVMRMMHNGRRVGGRHESQWSELYAQVLQEMKDTGCDLFSATDRVVSYSPAPRFYMTQRNALRLCYENRIFSHKTVNAQS